MNFIQSVLQTVEVGKGQFLVRIIPLVTAVLAVAVFYDLGQIQTPLISIGGVFRGLSDAQSMDNAQLARQIVRGKGFTTEFLRPHAIAQLRDYAMSQSLQTGKSGELFPADQFPPGAPRTIPDTYNAPAYPYLLAAWFFITHPEFDQTAQSLSISHIYSGDRWIPMLNQIFLLLTAVLVFALGRRLFDQRVAWMSLVSFLATDLIWRYSITALSTTFIMLVVTAILLCVLEIFCVGEACHENDEISFAPAWFWALAASLLIGIACLTRLHLLVILVPIFLLLMRMPRASFALLPVIAVVVAAMVLPWFFHLDKVCGTPLGSNAPLMLYGEGDYRGNEIYCTTSIPNYERLFKDATKKETTGFRYNFEHAWSLLGSNPLILLFGASILHQFKRRRTRLFHWLLFACTIALIAANNLGVSSPEDIGPWNIVIILFPCMLVMGCAFFFILLDRLNLQLWLLNNLIVTCILVLTALPLTVSLTATNETFYAFPPYVPPAIKSYGQCANTDEWITSDMPWATAWYADRASLWLPDSISDFESLHDNVCPTGILILTPVMWSLPISTVTTGEYKDWLSFVVRVSPPSNFPLSAHYEIGAINYALWSDHPRWLRQ